MTRRMTVEDLLDLAIPEQPALSPDRTRVAYVLRTNDADTDASVRNLWHVPVEGGAARQLTHGGADTSPAWSPDGQKVAFLRSQDGPGQLWLLPMSGGEPEQLTSRPLGAGAPVWSPDGTRIAFTAVVDTVATAHEDDAGRASRANAPIATDRLDHQADGVGQLGTMRAHVHVLDLATRECRQLTEGDWHASAPAWSPDGTTLAFSAAMDQDADLTLRMPVYVLAAGDRAATPELVGLTDGVAGPIAWAADGAALLVVGYPGQPTGHARLLHLTVDGGRLTDLGAPLDRNVMSGGPGYPGAPPQLAGTGDSVAFCARDRGCTHLFTTALDGGSAPRLVLGGSGRNVAGASVRGTTAAVVLSTPTSYGEIVVLDLDSGAETVLTDHGASHTEIELFPRAEREFTISDGTVVHGWLLRDPEITSPQPLLLDIHGGPHNAWNGAADDVHLYHQVLVTQGWAVLLLNPRGSDGYGETFFKAAIGAWGTADAKDFLEPLDELVAEGTADPARLAVTGYSYGGFMTCYLTSRDPRFAAAVTGGAVSDLTSMAGTSDAGHFLAELELAARSWADEPRYAAMSPLTHVDQVRTPTLVLHGLSDVRCPVGQAEQWHTALREQGVPTRLVLFPGAAHIFILDGKPSHRTDFNRRIVDWVEQYAGDASGPRPPRIDAAHWQRRLAVLADRYRVPGASLGILRLHPGRAEEQVEAAYGVLNVDTGVETTTESLFQIGSISKVWTATVVMQLVDEGLLDLDAPLVDVLPELTLADPEVTKGVTMRHLLTHTSGIDGDVFTDTGRGDDCLEAYVARLDEASQNHPLGATWSYCNSGFSLMGRVIEKLTGQTWDAAMHDRVFVPLGLQHTATLPEDVLLHRAAVGHVAEGADQPVRAPVWGLPRSLGPAGLISSTPADVLAFARMHLSGGVGVDGTQVLSGSAVSTMAAKHADLPDTHSLGDSWGLGWIRFAWDGHRVIGHDGNTIGQSAFLRLLPDQQLAVTLLTNGGSARDLYEALYREIFAVVAGVDMPHPLTPMTPSPTVDVGRHVGTYERASARIEVFEDSSGARLRTTVTGPLAALLPDPVEEFDLVPADETGDLFVIRGPATEAWTPVMFYELATGERYVHMGVRATPKVA